MTIVSVVGARPQFIKAAPVSRALRANHSEFLLHTGQHYDDEMSRTFFDELGIPAPNIDLGIGSGSHGEQTGRMLAAIEAVLRNEEPRLVLVYGDTNSTLAGALAAAKLGIAVAHVEAGLRSGRREMAEEINRTVVDHVATLLFCPTETAVRRLALEGITEGVVLVGDVMVDALDEIRAAATIDRARSAGAPIDHYAVATLHRAETVDHHERLERALDLLGRIPKTVVFPVHPRTQRRIAEFDIALPANVIARDPVGYTEMAALVAHSDLLVTDSGGLQKEAVLLETPCVTLRDETEWPETTEGGWNVVVGLDEARFDAAMAQRPPGPRSTAFVPGASLRIVEAISRFGAVS